MRIVGEIAHPSMKITIFNAGDKLSVKFEQNLLEQIYKFRDGSGIQNATDAEKWLTNDVLERIESIFHQMAKNRHLGLEVLHEIKGKKFPTII